MKLEKPTDDEIIKKLKGANTFGLPLCVLGFNAGRMKQMAMDGKIVRMVINGEVRYKNNS